MGEPGASRSLGRQGGSGLAMGQGGQTTSLGGLAVFLFGASGGEKNTHKKNKTQMLIFLVPTHSLTMNRNMIEISTSVQSRLTFKANVKSLKTHSSWNNVHIDREDLNKRTEENKALELLAELAEGPVPHPGTSRGEEEQWFPPQMGIHRVVGERASLAPWPPLSAGSLEHLQNQSQDSRK